MENTYDKRVGDVKVLLGLVLLKLGKFGLALGLLLRLALALLLLQRERQMRAKPPLLSITLNNQPRGDVFARPLSRPACALVPLGWVIGEKNGKQHEQAPAVRVLLHDEEELISTPPPSPPSFGP